MGEFRIICGVCGSDKIIEKTARSEISNNEYLEGIKRKCLDCSNESFSVTKSYLVDSNHDK